MVNYRRARVPGACYFFTVVTYERRPILTEPLFVRRLREAFRRVRAVHPFDIDAVVVLPDHMHTVWRLPEGDDRFALRWRKIKHFVSIGVQASDVRPSLAAKREKGIWQRRYWEHLVRDDADWQRHVDYVHYNPIKHGLVTRPGEWPFSSFARAVQMGWYGPEWGATAPGKLAGLELEWGE